MIVLDDGHALVQVHPDLGAAIGRYDLVGNDRAVSPIFQTAPSPGRDGPFALGMNLLVPFSNRISRGGFWHDGVFHPLARNTSGPYPIHGNALWLPWTVRESSATAVSLALVSQGPGPFRYEAEVTYRLDRGALTLRLGMVNRGATSLPFGGGFHPWFVRSPGTRLALAASGYWTETADHLPDAYRPTNGDNQFDFASGRDLPRTFVNNAFTGWNGRAVLEWLDRGLGVEITAPAPLTSVILYSPSATADFVCIEPVSHSVDAHNRSDPGTAPPQVLAPGEGLLLETTVRPFTL